MSAGQRRVDASDAGPPRDPGVPPPSEAVIPPAVAPLDADKAVFEPAGSLGMAEAVETADTTDGGIAGTSKVRAASASVKPLRKTCILKLDGCHYTIGTNAPRTARSRLHFMLLMFANYASFSSRFHSCECNKIFNC